MDPMLFYPDYGAALPSDLPIKLLGSKLVQGEGKPLVIW